MSQSLRDQLLGLGYAPVEKPARPIEKERRPTPAAAPAAARPAQPAGARPAHRERPSSHAPNAAARQRPGKNSAPARGPARSQQEIDLGKAYALRAQKEKDDRIETERLKQEEAKKRREAKLRLSELLKGKSLNDPAAEIARHFEYGGKIKRIYVTAEQLRTLNAGELGVAQMDGRYQLIPAELLGEAEKIFPAAVALRVDPNAAPSDDPYSDPAYQVPDDLVW